MGHFGMKREPRLSNTHLRILQHALDICESDYTQPHSGNKERTVMEIRAAKKRLDEIEIHRRNKREDKK